MSASTPDTVTLSEQTQAAAYDPGLEPPAAVKQRTSTTEAGTLPEVEADRIPNLDGDAPVVVIPITPPPSLLAAQPTALAPGDDEDTSILEIELATLPSSAAPTTTSTTSRAGLTGWWRWPWRRRKPRLPAHLMKPRRSPGEWLYAVADGTLARLNTPLAARDPALRSIVGMAATATLIVCLLANFVLPHVIRPRTALTFLQEKVTEMRIGPQTAVAAPAAGHH
jgi:hypothetical protein